MLFETVCETYYVFAKNITDGKIKYMYIYCSICYTAILNFASVFFLILLIFLKNLMFNTCICKSIVIEKKFFFVW